MRSHSWVVVATLLLVQAVPVLAADGLPGATVHPDGVKTQADRKARYEQWCRDNAEKCKEAHARREQCRANPQQCVAERQARSQERFRKADVNADGRISREEADQGLPGVARNFDRIDANKDGLVTVDELKAARKARAGNRKGPAGSLQSERLV